MTSDSFARNTLPMKLYLLDADTQPDIVAALKIERISGLRLCRIQWTATDPTRQGLCFKEELDPAAPLDRYAPLPQQPAIQVPKILGFQLS
eukprot:m.632195 g.632195  ORF g.632195 m.632195 type:complete len:91 (-) comp58290_c0_seq12:1322-1594(-)